MNGLILCCNCKSQPNRKYSTQHDASYCANCRLWLERACADAWCAYCKDRPANPPEEEE